VHYVQWMLESVDKNLLENANVQEVELQYKAESLLHDEILSEVEVGEGGTRNHRLIRVSDGKELAVGRSVWE
ncbi:MAG: hypothetical protein AAGA10_30890, partial [Bacteroidota bacterium]